MSKIAEENISMRDGIPISTVPSLGWILKDGRSRHGLTQTALSDLTDVPCPEISRVENGVVKKPSKSFLKKISPYVGYPFTKLLPIAGYSVSDQEPIYYNTKMEIINYLDIVQDIYKADADLLDCLNDVHEFTSPEEVKVIKLLLKVMYRMAVCRKEISEEKQNTFSAFKSFTVTYLSGLLEN